MKKTPIGQYDQRIIIQQLTRTSDDMGGHTESWSTFATVWAKVDDFSGDETFKANQIQSSVNYRVKIRYLSGVTPEMRIKMGSRYLKILAVLNPEFSNWELELSCEEIPQGGS